MEADGCALMLFSDGGSIQWKQTVVH
jgi:hypothetical protein